MATNSDHPKATSQEDPYKTYEFRIKWDGKYVAGVSKVSGLTRTTEVVKHRSGGNLSAPRQLAGQTEYGPITLERGVTHDVTFEQWANKVWTYHNSTTDYMQGEASNQDASLKNFRKDIVIELFNEAGQRVLAYKVYRCWPSEYETRPGLDGNELTAIQSLKLEYEGCERDMSIAEPEEPSSTLPPT